MQTNGTPIHRIRNLDQVHTNAAYLHDDYGNGRPIEKIWIKQTKF